MSTQSNDDGVLTRLLWLGFVALLTPFFIGLAISEAFEDPRVEDQRREVTDVVLPFQMQANFFQSLPIAGLMVTPDQIDQLLTLNPRLRVTTGMPLSGKGVAMPSKESDVVDTPAEPLME